MRSTGEMLYLLMIIGVFTLFALALAWVQLTWRPKGHVDADRDLPHATK